MVRGSAPSAASNSAAPAASESSNNTTGVPPAPSSESSGIADAGIPNTLNVISNFPFFVVGVISLVLCYYGNYFKLRFFDDLCPYVVIQFVPCIAIPLMAILMPPMYTHSTYWLWAAGFYLLAKIEEAADKPIYNLTHHILSGHTLKHLCAAMIPIFLTLMLAKMDATEERYFNSINNASHWWLCMFSCILEFKGTYFARFD